MSLATMNWKRGLLRLWAVAAVLWVGVAFYSNNTVQRVRDAYAWENNPYAKYAETPSAVTLPPLPKGAVTISGNSSAAGSSTGRFFVSPELLEAEKWGILPADKVELLAEARRRGLIEDAAAPQKPSIWPPLFDFAKLAFIPPPYCCSRWATLACGSGVGLGGKGDALLVGQSEPKIQNRSLG